MRVVVRRSWLPFALIVTVVAVLALASAPRASAFVESEYPEVFTTNSSGTTTLTPGAQQLVKEGAGINTARDLKSPIVRVLSKGAVLPQLARFVPYAGAALTAYELCNALFGCFKGDPTGNYAQPTAFSVDQYAYAAHWIGTGTTYNCSATGDWNGVYFTRYDRTTGGQWGSCWSALKPADGPTCTLAQNWCLAAVNLVGLGDLLWGPTGNKRWNDTWSGGQLPPSDRPTGWKVAWGTAFIGYCHGCATTPPSFTEQQWQVYAPISSALNFTHTSTSTLPAGQTGTLPAPPATWPETTAKAITEDQDRAKVAQQLAYDLNPQSVSDPVSEEDERTRRCRPADSVPAGDPAPLRGSQDYLGNPVQWRARYETVPDVAFTMNGLFPETGVPATGGTVYMRWGFATLNASDAEADWKGWGFRKIVAKHGWGATALAKTQAALLTAPVPKGRYEQYTLENTPGLPNPGCDWVVVVQREPIETPASPEQTQSAAMNHLITAYGTPHAPE